MRNKVVILSLSLIMVLCSSFSVFGATTRELAMAEPSTSDTQGYLVITDPTLNDCNVFYWSIMPSSFTAADKSGSSPSMNIILEDDEIVFTALCTGTARVTLTRVYNSSSQYLCMSQQFTTSTSYTYQGIDDIEYYFYSGNIGIVDDNISSSSNFLSVIWGTDTSYQDEFDDLVDLLQDIFTRLGNIDDLVDGLEGRLDTSNDKLSDIYARLGVLNGHIDGLEGQLSDIYKLLKEVESDTSYIYNQLVYINDKLVEIESDTSYIYLQLESINIKLKNLIEAVGEESTEKLDDSSIGSLGNDEDAVLSDESSEIDNLSFSFGNAFDVVWNLISQAWQSNPKVFTLVIMCLTVGLIKLILNR